MGLAHNLCWNATVKNPHIKQTNKNEPTKIPRGGRRKKTKDKDKKEETSSSAIREGGNQASQHCLRNCYKLQHLLSCCYVGVSSFLGDNNRNSLGSSTCL